MFPLFVFYAANKARARRFTVHEQQATPTRTLLLGRNNAADDNNVPLLTVPVLREGCVGEQAAPVLRRVPLPENGSLVHQIAEALRLLGGEAHVHRIKVLLEVTWFDRPAVDACQTRGS